MHDFDPIQSIHVLSHVIYHDMIFLKLNKQLQYQLLVVQDLLDCFHHRILSKIHDLLILLLLFVLY